MAVSVTSILGRNGNPPQTIEVTLESTTACERATITASCVDPRKPPATASFVPGQAVTLTFDNDSGNACGSLLTITAVCEPGQGELSGGSSRTSFTVTCPSNCPTVTGAVLVDPQCNEEQLRGVSLVVRFTPPLPAGASAVVNWNFGGPTGPSSSGPSTAMDTVTGVQSQVTRRVLIEPGHPCRPVPGQGCFTHFGSATVNMTLSGQSCPPVQVELNYDVAPCDVAPPPCPPRPTISVQVPQTPWQAPSQAGEFATFTASLPLNAPIPLRYFWTVTAPGGTVWEAVTDVPTVTTQAVTGSAPNEGWRENNTQMGAIPFSVPGTYAVALRVRWPTTVATLCDATAPSQPFTLVARPRLDPDCPTIKAISPQIDCFDADPSKNKPGTVQFQASIDDPSGLVTGYQWEFGDGSPASTTSTNTVSHDYGQDGAFTAKLTLQTAGPCIGGLRDRAMGITVPKCPTQPQREAGGCFMLRLIATLLIAAALALVGLTFCKYYLLSAPTRISAMPPAPFQGAWLADPFWHYIVAAAILAGVGIVLLLIYAFLKPCRNKPCMWVLLLFGNILLGAGWIMLYFWACCAWIGPLGLVGMVVGAGLLVGWILECRPTRCQVLKELVGVLLPTILAIIAYILLIPDLRACAHPICPVNGITVCPVSTIAVYALQVGMATVAAALATFFAAACTKE
jgi:hypothetical protein